MDAGDAVLGGEAGGGAVEAEQGRALFVGADFQIDEGGVLADARAEGLGGGFFGSEAGGEVLRGPTLVKAMGLLSGGEDPVEEGRAETPDGGLDAVHFDEIGADGVDGHAWQRGGQAG